MIAITKEEIAQLYEPFRPEEHEVREGSTSGNKNKIRWFVYLRREAIIKRLDSIFPGEWEFMLSNVSSGDKHATATGSLIIRGITRDLNGSQAGGGEHAEKSAATDAFKRTASMWGIGLYLQSSPAIWTDYDYKSDRGTDWKMRGQREADALKQFNRWLSGQGVAPATDRDIAEHVTDPNGDNPQDGDKISVVFTTVNERQGTNRMFHTLHNGNRVMLTVWTREPFAKALYMERGDWSGAKNKPLNPSIPANLFRREGCWYLDGDLEPFDPDTPTTKDAMGIDDPALQ